MYRLFQIDQVNHPIAIPLPRTAYSTWNRNFFLSILCIILPMKCSIHLGYIQEEPNHSPPETCSWVSLSRIQTNSEYHQHFEPSTADIDQTFARRLEWLYPKYTPFPDERWSSPRYFTIYLYKDLYTLPDLILYCWHCIEYLHLVRERVARTFGLLFRNQPEIIAHHVRDLLFYDGDVGVRIEAMKGNSTPIQRWIIPSVFYNISIYSSTSPLSSERSIRWSPPIRNNPYSVQTRIDS